MKIPMPQMTADIQTVNVCRVSQVLARRNQTYITNTGSEGPLLRRQAVATFTCKLGPIQTNELECNVGTLHASAVSKKRKYIIIHFITTDQTRFGSSTNI